MQRHCRVCISECKGARKSRGNCPHSYGLRHSSTNSKDPFPYCTPIYTRLTSTINYRNFLKCFSSQSCVIYKPRPSHSSSLISLIISGDVNVMKLLAALQHTSLLSHSFDGDTNIYAHSTAYSQE
jgi:hypothetical protein